MNGSNLFFVIFLGTILVTRVALYLKPTASPSIGKLRLHHWMYGVILVIIGLLLQSIWSFAIGLGLFIDELPYILIGGKTHADNYSKESLLGVVILIVTVFIFKHQLFYLFI